LSDDCGTGPTCQLPPHRADLGHRIHLVPVRLARRATHVLQGVINACGCRHLKTEDLENKEKLVSGCEVLIYYCVCVSLCWSDPGNGDGVEKETVTIKSRNSQQSRGVVSGGYLKTPLCG
jgi:hypothetical protein